MVRGFNQFIDVLRNLIEKIKKVPENSNIQRRVLTTESAQRAIRSQGTSATMEQLAASMEEVSATVINITENIESIRKRHHSYGR